MSAAVERAELRAEEMLASDKERDDSLSLEKQDSEPVKTTALRSGLSDEDAEWLAGVSPQDQRKIYHKVDRRLVPMLALLYLIAHLDRADIGNAKIEGLEDSLGMTDTDYNVAVAVFFVPYVLCEVPSNLLLAKFSRPSYYMGTLVICWGLVMTFTGVVQSFGALVATRFLLGVFEYDRPYTVDKHAANVPNLFRAGFFPGAIWIVSQWYPPRKTQSRMAMFYLASALSGAFSGLLAAGIAQMDGLGGYEGWRWIFLIEGIASVLVGILCFFALPDSPSHAKRWLSRDQARFLELEHQRTRGIKTKCEDSKKGFSWKVLWQVLTDWQLYLQSLCFMSNAVPNYGLKFTMPQIMSNMGFESTNAQLLTAPPYTCGAIAAVVSAWFADRVTWRMPFITGAQTLLIIAYSILFAKAGNIEDNVALCYFCIFLACIGIYPILPGVNAWTINNLAGAEKRAMGIAFMIAVGNCGGLPGSFIYLDRESPKYPTGFGGSLSFAAAGMLAAFLLEFLYWSHNKHYAGVTEEEAIAKYGEEMLEAMGDKSPLFRYSY